MHHPHASATLFSHSPPLQTLPCAHQAGATHTRPCTSLVLIPAYLLGLPWTCLPPRRATTTSSHPDGCPCHPTMLASKCESHRKPHTSHLLVALSDRAYIAGEKNFPNLKKLNFTSYFHALEHTYILSLRALPVVLLGTSFTALLG